MVLIEKVEKIYNSLKVILDCNFAYAPDMPYILFAFLPSLLLVIMYACNKKLEKLEIQKKLLNHRLHWAKFVTSFSLLLSLFLIIFYFLFVYFERNHNIKLSLSVLLPMFSGWFISGVFSKVEFEDTLTQINQIIINIKKLKTKDSLNKIFDDLYQIKIDLHKFSIQSQIITTMIVLLTLAIYTLSVEELWFFVLVLVEIMAVGMGFIPGYRDLFEKDKNANKEFNKTTTLHFLFFSLENSPRLKNSFLVPRAMSVITVIIFSIYYNPVMQTNHKSPTKKGNEITVIAENNNTK